jgi:hypothetical protein
MQSILKTRFLSWRYNGMTRSRSRISAALSRYFAVARVPQWKFQTQIYHVILA